MFNIAASPFFDKNTRDAIAQGHAKVPAVLDNTPRSVSIVLGPDGMPISETKRDEEGILYAHLNVAQRAEPNQFHDVAGNSNRFAVSTFSLNPTHRDPATFVVLPEPQALENEPRLQDRQAEISSQQIKPFRHKRA